MAPLSDDRDRSFEKALARHFRAEAQAEVSSMPRTCADVETLAAYHEGGLAREEMSFWKTHVTDCARCQGILTQLAATEAIPFDAADDVEKQEARGVEVLRPRRAALWRWAAPAGALAAGLLVWVAVRENKPIQVAEVRKDAASAAQIATQKAPVAENKASDANEEQRARTRAAETAASGILKQKRELSRTERSSRVAPKPPPANGGQTSENAVSLNADTPQKSDAAEKTAAEAREFEQKAPAFISPPMAPVASSPEASSSTAVVAGAAPNSSPKRANGLESREPGHVALQQQQETSGMSRFKENQAMVLAKSVSAVTVAAPRGTTQWRIGAAGIIEYSADAGATWSLQSSGVITDLLAGSAASDKVCWIVGRAGTILRTTDGGVHWVKVRPPIVDDFASVFAVDARQATVSPAQGTYQTMDSGATWNKLAPE